MKKLTCEIGDTFGYWRVIDNTPITKSGHTCVTVQCKCGKTELKCLSDLVHGKATGCRNCMARKRGIPLQLGDKYKSWTVIDGPIVKNSTQLWLVKCECGNTRWIQANELTNPTKCFKCMKCMTSKRIQTFMQNNGAIGELGINKFHRLQRGAQTRNIPFTVSQEYLWDLFLKQNRCCALTGDPIYKIKDASLDRIDSNLPYQVGNVQWVTKQANVSKHVMSMEQLYDFCKKVLNHANQQPSQPLTKLEGSETNG